MKRSSSADKFRCCLKRFENRKMFNLLPEPEPNYIQRLSRETVSANFKLYSALCCSQFSLIDITCSSEAKNYFIST